jgi:hypothetical protein
MEMTPTIITQNDEECNDQMANPPEQAAHLTQIYILTLWRESEGAPWRAALRPAGSAERLGFADLEQLAIFLLCLADGRTPPDGAEGAGASQGGR